MVAVEARKPGVAAMQIVLFILFFLAYVLLAASGAAMVALVVSAVLGVAAAPFVLLFLAARGAIRLVQARGSRAFAWQPGDWGRRAARPTRPAGLLQRA